VRFFKLLSSCVALTLLMSDIYASSCVVKKHAGGEDIEVKKFEQSKFVYEYSDQKFVTIHYSFGKKEFYKISYQSLTDKNKPNDYTSYELTCDKFLSCDAQKKAHYSYYKKIEKMEISPSGYSVSLPKGGRDMFTFVGGNESFSYRFVDLQVTDGKWYGLSIDCSH